MARINVDGCGHGNKSEAYSDGVTIRYGEFATASGTGKARLEKVKQAVATVSRLDASMGLARACNLYFTRLPRGHSFRHYWRDDAIFINHCHSTAPGFFAATHSNNRDIALTSWCIDHHNHWVVGASIVHEFAHIGGAPGGTSQDAERATRECGFVPQYDPTIMGSLRSLAAALQRLG